MFFGENTFFGFFGSCVSMKKPLDEHNLEVVIIIGQEFVTKQPISENRIEMNWDIMISSDLSDLSIGLRWSV